MVPKAKTSECSFKSKRTVTRNFPTKCIEYLTLQYFIFPQCHFLIKDNIISLFFHYNKIPWRTKFVEHKEHNSIESHIYYINVLFMFILFIVAHNCHLVEKLVVTN